MQGKPLKFCQENREVSLGYSSGVKMWYLTTIDSEITPMKPSFESMKLHWEKPNNSLGLVLLDYLVHNPNFSFFFVSVDTQFYKFAYYMTFGYVYTIHTSQLQTFAIH